MSPPETLKGVKESTAHLTFSETQLERSVVFTEPGGIKGQVFPYDLKYVFFKNPMPLGDPLTSTSFHHGTKRFSRKAFCTQLFSKEEITSSLI